MKKRIADPESEAAIKYVIKHWDKIFVTAGYDKPVLYFRRKSVEQPIIGILDLRKFVAKRQALTGVKRQLRQMVQGKRKRKKK